MWVSDRACSFRSRTCGVMQSLDAAESKMGCASPSVHKSSLLSNQVFRKRLHCAGNIARWNRLADQVTLRVGTSIGTDRIKFFLGLDSLGQNRHADAFAQHHNRTDDGAFFRRHTDQRTVYLDGVKM